jgi:beta-lactamase regulating signal transducer with metallopeptidase domain
LRYIFSLSVFLLAVLLPFAVTIKVPSGQIAPVYTSARVNQQGAEIKYSPGQNDFFIREDNDWASTEISGTSAADLLDEFISIIATSSVGTVFLCFWISGIVFLFFQESVGIWGLKQARKFWKPANDSERQALLCPKDVTLYFDEHQSPGTIGLLRPVIVLPKHFPSDYRLIQKDSSCVMKWHTPEGETRWSAFFCG